MRHRKNDKKLGRKSAHRKAMIASLVCALIERKRIKTTLAKAKVARRQAEKMVTHARKGTLAARRHVISALRREGPVATLFGEITSSLDGRQGGYTRIVKLGPRRSDGSEMAMLEWVGTAPPENKVTKVEPEE